MKLAQDKRFFSYATVAPMSQLVYEAVKEFTDDFYRIGPPEILYKYEPLADELAREAATLLNCFADEITTIKNTTAGINLSGNILPLDAGDEVLVQANEYPANLLPWMALRERGITVTTITGAGSVESYHNLLAAISEHTKVIAISAAQYYDGFITDLAEISAICSKHNIFLVLDAVQLVGVRKIDLNATPVDILVCGGQKYLQAGMGIGFMYVNKKLFSRLRVGPVGIRSMKQFDQESFELKATADRYQDGTQNLAGIVGLHAALKHVNHVGIEVIEETNRKLLHQFKEILNSYKVPFIDHGEQQANIIALQIKNPVALADYLIKRGCYIKPTKDVARLSFIPQSLTEDVEEVAKLTREWIGTQSNS